MLATNIAVSTPTRYLPPGLQPQRARSGGLWGGAADTGGEVGSQRADPGDPGSSSGDEGGTDDHGIGERRHLRGLRAIAYPEPDAHRQFGRVLSHPADQLGGGAAYHVASAGDTHDRTRVQEAAGRRRG